MFKPDRNEHDVLKLGKLYQFKQTLKIFSLTLKES